MSKLYGLVVGLLFLSRNGIKMQFLGVVGFKSSTLTVYCLSSRLVHKQRKTYSNLCVLCWLSHISWFQWPKYFPPSFWPQFTNHDVRQKFSFSAVDFIISKEGEIFGPKILMMVTTISFFIWRFGCLEAEQKPVLTSLNRNCWKLPCTETRIAQPPKQIERSSICARGRWTWAKNAVFQIHVHYFLFWQNIICWKILLPQHYTC